MSRTSRVWSAGCIDCGRWWWRRRTAPPAAAGADPAADRRLRRSVHQAIRQVSADLEAFEFNTVVSGLMELTNALAQARQVGREGSDEFRRAVETLLLLAAPVVPHLAEELWHRLGRPYSIHQQPWPALDTTALAVEEITLIVQINGKVRDRIQLSAGVGDDEAKQAALASSVVQKHLAGRTPVPGGRGPGPAGQYRGLIGGRER